jgi:hypothetical protein
MSVQNSKPPEQTTEIFAARAARVQRAVVARPGFEDTIFPIPIRGDVTVRIQGLPFDLTQAEADKLSAVIMAYVQERGDA